MLPPSLALQREGIKIRDEGEAEEGAQEMHLCGPVDPASGSQGSRRSRARSQATAPREQGGTLRALSRGHAFPAGVAAEELAGKFAKENIRNIKSRTCRKALAGVGGTRGGGGERSKPAARQLSHLCLEVPGGFAQPAPGRVRLQRHRICEYSDKFRFPKSRRVTLARWLEVIKDGDKIKDHFNCENEVT